MKIRFLRDYQEYRKGQVIDVRFSKALRLISGGIAIKDKMMTEYKRG